MQNYIKSQYQILGISVDGSKSADPATIIANTGLKVGSEIEVPGDETINAIKRLWSLGIFEDVQIIIDKTLTCSVNRIHDTFYISHIIKIIRKIL